MKRARILTLLLALPLHAGCGVPAGDGGDGAVGDAPMGSTPADGAAEDASSNGDATRTANGNDNTADDDSGEDNGSQTDDNADEVFPDGPPADACEAVMNRTFEIAGRSLAFIGNLFSWITSDGQVIGTYSCDGFKLVGVSPDDEEFVGSYDALSDAVTWQGTIYLPVP